MWDSGCVRYKWRYLRPFMGQKYYFLVLEYSETNQNRPELSRKRPTPPKKIQTLGYNSGEVIGTQPAGVEHNWKTSQNLVKSG